MKLFMYDVHSHRNCFVDLISNLQMGVMNSDQNLNHATYHNIRTIISILILFTYDIMYIDYKSGPSH